MNSYYFWWFFMHFGNPGYVNRSDLTCKPDNYYILGWVWLEQTIACTIKLHGL